ncbi:MAG: hypothetical protein ACREOW_07585 [Thermodesulfobacteriota bacterium]
MSKEFKHPSDYFLDKPSPIWDRGEVIETTPDGIEVRLSKEDKSIIAIKQIPAGMSKKNREKLQEKCQELATAKLIEYLGKQKVYGIEDFSDTQAIICEVSVLPKWALKEYLRVLPFLRATEEIRRSLDREERRLRKKYPKALRIYKRIMYGDDEKGIYLLMKHAGIDPEEWKKKKPTESYEKQDAFDDILLKGVFNPKGHFKAEVVKDFQFLPRGIKLRRTDAYRKGSKKKSKEYPEWFWLVRPPRKYELELIPDIAHSHEFERASELEKWIKSIKDPKDREFARLRHRKKLTLRQIEAKSHIPKSTIHDRLKKLKPPF